ncbi:hypothetical protein AB5N19_09471 [Seiridium cardinale]
MSAPPPKPGGGLSLYADLLDPPGDSSASISRAPQVSQQALDAVKEQEAAAAKKTDAALRFQPIQNIRRPQQKTQKPKTTFPKPAGGATATTTTNNAPGSGIVAGAAGGAPPAPVKSTLADWANTEDDEWMYAGEKRPRNNKKKKKRHDAPVETDWDEIYDPSRPTNVDEYLRSDERIREVREWKALLYRHRKPTERKRQSSWDSGEEEDRPMGNQFAPPPAYSFAPPPPSPPRAAAEPLPDDKTGDDAYARRLALSQGIPPPPPPPPEPSHAEPILPPSAPPPPPPTVDTSTISRAPVRYTQPSPPEPAEPDAMDEDVPEKQAEDENASQSNRPGKKGFAARIMSKYGWSKGQGLGAEGTGIVAPLRVQVEKRKKKSDAEGGGWAQPGGLGKIIQPKANKPVDSSSSSDQGGKFGPMSNVIVLRHMLDNIENLQHEIEEGLGQEIGEECGDKYGRVERLYVDVTGGSRNVYIKFVETVSALRAVNALDGRGFAGSSIEPRFYDVEMFEKGVYE